jgi:hypothetical protein
MSAIIKIFAKNPPSIAIALAGVLMLAGQTGAGILFLAVGVVLQALWLLKGRS